MEIPAFIVHVKFCWVVWSCLDSNPEWSLGFVRWIRIQSAARVLCNTVHISHYIVTYRPKHSLPFIQFWPNKCFVCCRNYLKLDSSTFFMQFDVNSSANLCTSKYNLKGQYTAGLYWPMSCTIVKALADLIWPDSPFNFNLVFRRGVLEWEAPWAGSTNLVGQSL